MADERVQFFMELTDMRKHIPVTAAEILGGDWNSHIGGRRGYITAWLRLARTVRHVQGNGRLWRANG